MVRINGRTPGLGKSAYMKINLRIVVEKGYNDRMHEQHSYITLFEWAS